MERDDWYACLGKPPEEVTERIRKERLIETASLSLHLERKFKKSQLEALLRERRLSVEGNKADLILRLMKADEVSARDAVGSFDILQCSDEGAALANAHLSSVADEMSSDEFSELLGSYEKARFFALWVSSAILAGVIGNNADRIFTQMLRVVTEPAPKEQKPTSGEAAQHDQGPQWKEEDLERYYALYSLPIVIFFRFCLACYLRDEGCPGLSGAGAEGLAAFDKRYYEGKFIVLALNGNPWGGTNITITFQHKPDKVFVAWIYEFEAGGRGDFDDEESSNSFELRGFWDYEMSPSQIEKNKRDMRLFLEDKVHAM
jgi:hypothetical protein